ncbi:TPA: hypothetical protein SMP92_002018 [Pseudomonas putida]|nr:hypothetical protein [Pseudomonas putida]
MQLLVDIAGDGREGFNASELAIDAVFVLEGERHTKYTAELTCDHRVIVFLNCAGNKDWQRSTAGDNPVDGIVHAVDEQLIGRYVDALPLECFIESPGCLVPEDFEPL